MSAHVLLNLLNELRRKEIKFEAWRAFFFHNGFNKLNKSEARMLGSIFHMTFKIILKSYFNEKTLEFCHMLVKSVISKHFPKICKPRVVYPFLCMALFHTQT